MPIRSRLTGFGAFGQNVADVVSVWVPPEHFPQALGAFQALRRETLGILAVG